MCLCRATINRYGFNSDGVDATAERLAALRERQIANPDSLRGVVGVNLGKNKMSADAAADYCVGVTKLGPYAEFLVINISSPNTPGGFVWSSPCRLPATRSLSQTKLI